MVLIGTYEKDGLGNYCRFIRHDNFVFEGIFDKNDNPVQGKIIDPEGNTIFDGDLFDDLDYIIESYRINKTDK